MKPRWTKVHFELLARVISKFEPEDVRRRIAKEFIIELHDKNPQFDDIRFYNACAVGDSEREMVDLEVDDGYD
ncbi:hypothetical protein GOV11_00840 [Candidatus Woesearchaeota archaeon]|nr:hypothetical protein [Candidatus Woesearchaeota archaeon]